MRLGIIFAGQIQAFYTEEMNTENQFAFPYGWYGVAFSHEVRPMQIIHKTVCHTPIIVWRGENGIATVMPAYCPHLGAHLGYQGTVVNNNIRCQFHGFSFGQDGHCLAKLKRVSDGEDAKIKPFVSKEQNGIIMAFFHPQGLAPNFDIPPTDVSNYYGPRFYRYLITGHVEDIAENSVDILHFKSVHEYDHAQVIEPAKADGPHLTAWYKVARSGKSLGKKKPIELQFHATVSGLGHSEVDAYIPSLNLKAKNFVWATPTTPGHVELNIGMYLQKLDNPTLISKILGLLPRSIIHRIVLKLAFSSYKHDVGQDVPIFNHKAHVDDPYLSPNDGPIALYRSWTKQFYK